MQFCPTCLSRPVQYLSNVAFPACSLAEIREAILKAFAFGERGLLSSIREKPSQRTAFCPRTPPFRAIPCREHRQHKQKLEENVTEVAFVGNRPFGDVGALHCFQNKLFPLNLARHGLLYMLQLKRSVRARPAVLKHRA